MTKSLSKRKINVEWASPPGRLSEAAVRLVARLMIEQAREIQQKEKEALDAKVA